MLTFQIMPYGEISGLSSVGRIRKLLNLAKQDKIVLLQGRLDKEEEAELIKATMEEINKEFKGIELAVMDSLDNGALNGFDRLKGGVANMLLGNRGGLTLVGPANVVKKVKKNPKHFLNITEYLEDKFYCSQCNCSYPPVYKQIHHL